MSKSCYHTNYWIIGLLHSRAFAHGYLLMEEQYLTKISSFDIEQPRNELGMRRLRKKIGVSAQRSKLDDLHLIKKKKRS